MESVIARSKSCWALAEFLVHTLGARCYARLTLIDGFACLRIELTYAHHQLHSYHKLFNLIVLNRFEISVYLL